MHKPVLLNEVIKTTNPKPGEFFIDGTINGGGYAREIIKNISPGGIFLGIEWDNELFAEIKSNFEKEKYNCRIIIRNENYANIPEILKSEKLPKADGLVLDLGYSLWQIEKSKRGFSFNKDEPLIMTYNRKDAKITAYDVVNQFSEEKLAEIIYRYGEEKKSRQIARKIVLERKRKPIKTSLELAQIISKANPKRSKIHPATKTFQALRIYVNQELENLERLLKNTREVVKSGGRVSVTTFHSLEDRIVKRYFIDLKNKKEAIMISGNVIKPTKEEIKNNPKSRSAKLRVIKII